MPGYGWIFPLGDGTINVGIGLLSTFKGYKDVNTTHLMTEWAATAPERWGIDPDAMLAPPTGGRLPMAGSINPKVGPQLAAGRRRRRVDQPVQRRGHRLRLRDRPHGRRPGRRGARHGHGARRSPATRTLLDDEYGLYFKVARNFAKIIGQPVLMRELTRVGMRSQSLMEWVLRIMANLLRDDELGPAEAAYRAVARIARLVPDPAPV